MTIDPNDAWLMPNRQAEQPGRDPVAAVLLHGRREGTFLALVAMFVLGTTTLVLAGSGHAIDVRGTFAAIGLELGTPLDLPIWALAFPIAMFAANLACELYGRRRATAMVTIGMVVALAVVGLVAIANVVDNTAAIGPALAFAACATVANLANVNLYDGLRRREGSRWLRALLAPISGNAVGWVAFAFVLYGFAVGVDGQPEKPVIAHAIAVAGGSALYGVGFAIVALLPFAIAARALAGYLRVGPDPEQTEKRLPAATIVEELDTRRPFNTGEQKFFAEGEELSRASGVGPRASASGKKD